MARPCFLCLSCSQQRSWGTAAGAGKGEERRRRRGAGLPTSPSAHGKPTCFSRARSPSSSKSRWELTHGIPDFWSGLNNGIEPLQPIDRPVPCLSFSPPFNYTVGKTRGLGREFPRAAAGKRSCGDGLPRHPAAAARCRGRAAQLRSSPSAANPAPGVSSRRGDIQF